MTNVGGFTPNQASEIWETTKLLRSSGLLRNASKITQSQTIPFVQIINEDYETIPAFGCVQIIGTLVQDGRTFLRAVKPDKTNGKYLINYDRDIEFGKAGMAVPWGVVRMLGVAPSEPKDFGPTIDAWTVQEQDGGPFTVYGADAFADGVVKGRITGGGGGALQIIRFTFPSEYYDSGADKNPRCDERTPAMGPFYGIVNQKACGGGTVYGMDEEGMVELVDRLNIINDRHEPDLEGRIGIAVLMKIERESIDEYLPPEDDYLPDCEWVIVYVEFHRMRDVVSDVIISGNSITIERERHWVWDHCQIPPEVIAGIECPEEDTGYDGYGI